jgi:hypothetical protein
MSQPSSAPPPRRPPPLLFPGLTPAEQHAAAGVIFEENTAALSASSHSVSVRCAGCRAAHHVMSVG